METTTHNNMVKLYECLANDLLDYLCETIGVRETIDVLKGTGYSKYDCEDLQFDREDIKAMYEEE